MISECSKRAACMPLVPHASPNSLERRSRASRVRAVAIGALTDGGSMGAGLRAQWPPVFAGPPPASSKCPPPTLFAATPLSSVAQCPPVPSPFTIHHSPLDHLTTSRSRRGHSRALEKPTRPLELRAPSPLPSPHSNPSILVLLFSESAALPRGALELS